MSSLSMLVLDSLLPTRLCTDFALITVLCAAGCTDVWSSSSQPCALIPGWESIRSSRVLFVADDLQRNVRVCFPKVSLSSFEGYDSDRVGSSALARTRLAKQALHAAFTSRRRHYYFLPHLVVCR
ncbi:hypothetical protein BDV97DRAFT_68940 [Delphinella strobiligena]|nr:hypothetical protein BDV97DRAFT_68940 [Delphinella strobiligena]